MSTYEKMHPQDVRALIRRGEWQKPTAGVAAGYAQANLVVLPEELAFSFLLFCQRNPKPCPVLDVTEPGSPIPQLVAPKADLRVDVPKYRVYRHGKFVEERTEIETLWDERMVGFLLGCSFTFEWALIKNGIAIRHIEEGVNVPMYQTDIPCSKAGPFAGPMVVSMRPIAAEDVSRAVQITARYPQVHGAPIQIGHPEKIGIQHLGQPDFGDPVTIADGEVPVFWACGVTPQAAALHAQPEIMITHAPGHMFITDIPDSQYEVC